MQARERFGRFVLHSPDAQTSAASFFRAAQFSAAGYERHVTLLRTGTLPADVAERVAEGLRNAGAASSAHIVRFFDSGRIEGSAFAAYEFFEGRPLRELLRRSRSEGHAFAADHALLIASRSAAALEAAHAKKVVHGFLTPEFVAVSHDGEVRVRGFGLAPGRFRDARLVGPAESIYLAPEVAAGSAPDARSDVWSVSAQLFEMLTGEPVDKTRPAEAEVSEARTAAPGGGGEPLPEVMAQLLVNGLVLDPSKRFKDAPALRKAIDTLLFSGDYSPTTFNLAFFMHTLFGDDGDQDANAIREEKALDYKPYVAQMRAATTQPAPVRPAPRSDADATLVDGPAPARQDHDATVVDIAPARHSPPPVAPLATARPATRPSPPAENAPPPSPPSLPLLESAAEKNAKLSRPIVPLAIAGVVLVGVGALYAFFGPGGSTPASPVASAPTAMSAAEQAALAKVRELEAKLAAIEADRVAAEQQAADEARKKLEAQAAARGRAVDPAELARAQDEARRKAQAEQEARLNAERQKLEEEKTRAEEQRRQAEEAARTEAQRSAVDAVAPPATAPSTPAAALGTPIPASAAPTAPVSAPSTSTPPPSTPAPSGAPTGVGTPPSALGPAGPTGPGPVAAGSGAVVLNPADPSVTPPQLVSQARPEYPPLARSQRVGGTVIISALIDEQGNVAEARVIRGVPGNMGLNEAALASVRKRKYKPAMSKGQPGRAWIAIQIDFKP